MAKENNKTVIEPAENGSDYMYILDEFEQQLNASIENLDSVIKQQEELIELVNKNETTYQKPFIEKLTSTVVEYRAQRDVLIAKKDYIEKFKTYSKEKNSEEVYQAARLLMNAFFIR